MPLTTINAAKDLKPTSYQPLLIATVTFTDSPATILRLCTHPLRVSDGGFQYGGNDYLPRILNQDIAATQAMSEQGIDLAPSVNLILSDGDRFIWTNHEKAIGFKGAKLKLEFIFWDADTATFSSDIKVIFVGICGPAQLDNEDEISVSAVNLLNLSRFNFPTLRIQKRCPWVFPTTAKQREAAVLTEDSPFFYCGYGPDVDSTGTAIGSPPVTPHADARGNFNAGVPFTVCNFTKADCEARGMYEKDNATPNRNTARYGGIQWSPPESQHTKGLDGKWLDVGQNPNIAKYNDYFPLVYGKSNVEPPVMNIVGDANLTKLEAVLSFGEIDAVERVIINDVVVAQGTQGGNTIAGFWNYVATGTRTGARNLDALYTDSAGLPLGDPYGSLACIEVVIPRALSETTSTPRIRVLLRGRKVRVYTNPTTFTRTWSENPIWIMLDALVLANWDYADIDIQSFIDAAAVCDVSITYTDLNNLSQTHARYKAGLVIRQRVAANEFIRGLRNNCKAILGIVDGKLKVSIKRTLADQQPSTIAGSNYNTAVASKNAAGTATDGFVAHKFDEATLRLVDDGGRSKSTLTVSQSSLQETPNRIGMPFSNEFNDYARDSIEVANTADIVRSGQEVPALAPAEGITNFDQATRIIKWMMAEGFQGNTRGGAAGDTGGTLVFSFETSFTALHLQVGRVCLFSHTQLGITNKLIRILKIQPATNFETCRITAALHSDEWYLNSFGQDAEPRYDGRRRDQLDRPPFAWQPYEVQPRTTDPLYDSTEWSFGLAPIYEAAGDKTALARLRVSGKLPVNDFSVNTRPPWVPLQGTTASTGGVLAGGKTYYCALVAKDTVGAEYGVTAPSELVRIAVPAGTNTNTITIPDIAWAAGSVGYILFAGTDPTKLAFHSTSDTTPTSITITTALNTAAYGMPDVEFDKARYKVKRVLHSGVVGIALTGCNLNKLIIQNAGWTVNEWTNYDCSIIAFKDATLASGVAITNATNASPISITAAGHGLATADRVFITGVLGNTAANGWYIVTVVDANTFTLNDSSGNGAYTSGGTSQKVNSLTPSTVAMAIANYTVASNTASVLTLTAGNPLDDGVGTGDVLIIRSRPNTTTPTTLGDSKWINAQGPSGLNVNEETGRIVRFIAGKGKGQVARIKSNTSTVLTIEGTFQITPDVTSRYIIEEPDWPYSLDDTPADVNHPLRSYNFDMPVDNLANQAVLVQGVLVDGGENESFPHQSPVREIYLYGDAGTGAAVPPANITGLTVTVDGYSDPSDDGSVNVRLKVTYVNPVPLGTFDGVHAYLDAPDTLGGLSVGSMTAGGSAIPLFSPLDLGKKPRAENPFFVQRRAPQESEIWRIYGASYSDEVDNTLVAVGGAGATPSATVTVFTPAQASGENFAQLVTNLAVTVEFDPVSGSLPPRVRVGFRRWRFTATWQVPVFPPRSRQQSTFGGIDILLEEATLGNRSLLASEQGATYTSPWFDLPRVTTEFWIWGLSYDSRGRRNSLRTGVTPRAVVTIQANAAAGVAGQENTPNVTAISATFVYVTNAQGQKVLIITTAYTKPNDPRWGGVDLGYDRGDGVWRPLTGSYYASGAFTDTRHEITNFPESNQTWKIYFWSRDVSGQHNVFFAADATKTPRVDLLVTPPPSGSAGVEFCANVTGLGVGVATFNSADGGYITKLTVTFTKPTDPAFAGVDVVRLVSGQADRDISLGVTLSPTEFEVQTPAAVESWSVYTPAFDVNGRRNTLTPGVTPVVAVSVGDGGGQSDFSRARAGTFDGAEFIVSAGSFRMNSISANKILTGQLLVGGGGGKPTRVEVFNVAGTRIGQIGIDGTDESWLKSLRVGGTSYATAQFQADASGNVSLTNGTLDVTAGVTRVKINPTDGLKVFESNLARTARVFGAAGGFYVVKDAQAFSFGDLSPSSVSVSSGVGTTASFAEMFAVAATNDAFVRLYGTGGYRTSLEASDAAGGSLELLPVSGSALRLRPTTATAATAGAQTLPANPAGFLSFLLGGAVIKIPYYNS